MKINKGDLVGFKDTEPANAYVITKVVREDRFYFGYSIIFKRHRFIVHDPEKLYVICPEYDLDMEPDESMRTISTEMYDALDRLFGFAESSDDADD